MKKVTSRILFRSDISMSVASYRIVVTISIEMPVNL